jgi:CHAT domain-containing protein
LRLLTDAEYGMEFDILVDELVDQYVGNELPEEEREQAERYFLASAERRDKLKFASALRRRKAELARDRPRRRSFVSFYLPVAASVLAVIGFTLIALRTQSPRPYASEGLAALQSAFREQRPVEARISGFGYAPTPEQRGGGPGRVDGIQLKRADSKLHDAVSDAPGADTHHALGKYYLATRDFDRAMEQFEAALKFDPQNARIHSDLGAALLERMNSRGAGPERGKGADEIEESAKALAHLKKALELDGSLLEALFNRALLYQRMGLSEAEADWRAYLEKDPNSMWADEARQNLAEVERRRNKTSRDGEQPLQEFLSSYDRGDDARAWEVVRRNYTSAGNAITNALVDSYLDSDAKGEGASAGDKLRALAYVGQLESQRAGDAYTSDLARFYERSDARQRRALALARAHMREGFRLFIKSEESVAIEHYERAKRAFEESGDDCEALFAEYRIAHCYLLQPDLKKSAVIFERLRPAFERGGYRWLLNQTLYRTASIRFTLNEYSESIEYTRLALEQSERMRDTVGTLKALVLLADQHRALNDGRESLVFLNRALALMRDEGAEPQQAWEVFTAVGLTLNSLDLNPAALEYHKEALRVAAGMEPERPLLISRSYDYLGLTHASLKDYDSALANIDLAFEAGRKVAGERSGKEMMANSSLHAGDVYRQAGNYARAVESYERSITLYEELDYPYFTYPARKGKLLSYIARGDDSATEVELRSVLEIFEDYRKKLTKESQRNTFFDVEQSVYDLAVDFAQSRRHDSQRAFEYSELSRARSLLDAIRRDTQAESEGSLEPRLQSTSISLTFPAIRRRMPEQSQIVQYALLDDKLVIWVITPARDIEARPVPIDSRALGEKIREYLRVVSAPSAGTGAETQERAKELYGVLIAPVEKLLDKSKLLCIVPDKLLHYVPFAALVAGDTSRYLVEDFRLILSPSSTIFVERSEEAAGRKAAAGEWLLSVGDPSFNAGAFPALKRLPSAGSEAEAIADLYSPQGRLLLHGEASERVVRSEIAKADVVHFALHYLVDERSNLFSKVVLASPSRSEASGGDDGVLQVHEIYKMRLPRARLVVLSACQTGVEHQYRGEGAVSVARPFIAAGVPLVVASLWPVDSKSTEALMVSFHRHRTGPRRVPTAEALRLAQLELLGGQDTRYRHPHYWSAFNAIGGYAEY